MAFSGFRTYRNLRRFGLVMSSSFISSSFWRFCFLLTFLHFTIVFYRSSIKHHRQSSNNHWKIAGKFLKKRRKTVEIFSAPIWPKPGWGRQAVEGNKKPGCPWSIPKLLDFRQFLGLLLDCWAHFGILGGLKIDPWSDTFGQKDAESRPHFPGRSS